MPRATITLVEGKTYRLANGVLFTKDQPQMVSDKETIDLARKVGCLKIQEETDAPAPVLKPKAKVPAAAMAPEDEHDDSSSGIDDGEEAEPVPAKPGPKPGPKPGQKPAVGAAKPGPKPAVPPAKKE